MGAIVGLLFAAATITAKGVHADLRPCPEIKKPGSKVLLDDVRGIDVDESMMRTLLARLTDNLAQIQLESDSKIGARSDGRLVNGHKGVRCQNRWPRSTADYKHRTIRALNDHEVALEVWAEISETARAGASRTASVGYLLVPIRHLRDDERLGVVTVPYAIKDTVTEETLLAMLDQSGRLAAYASAAAGVRYMKASNYDAARKHLCLSQARLMSLPAKGIAHDKRLLEYVANLAQEVVKQARDAEGYSGPLTLTESAACPLPLR